MLLVIAAHRGWPPLNLCAASEGLWMQDSESLMVEEWDAKQITEQVLKHVTPDRNSDAVQLEWSITSWHLWSFLHSHFSPLLSPGSTLVSPSQNQHPKPSFHLPFPLLPLYFPLLCLCLYRGNFLSPSELWQNLGRYVVAVESPGISKISVLAWR